MLPAPSSNVVPFLRAVFTWISANIRYDVRWYTQRANLPPQTPDQVLRTRVGVCEGYANLFMALCAAAGLGEDTVEKKIGAAKDVTFAPGHEVLQRNRNGKPTGHAWNCVFLNGRPYIMDSTWGAGSVGVGPNGYQFEPQVEALAKSSWLHGSHRHWMSQSDDFLHLPMTKPTFFEYSTILYDGRDLLSGSVVEIPEGGDGSVSLYLTTQPDEGKPQVKGSLRYPLSRTSAGNPNHHSGQVSFDGVFARYEGLGNAPGEDRVWMVTLLFRLPGPGEASVNWFIIDDGMTNNKKPTWLGYPSGTHGRMGIKASFVLLNPHVVVGPLAGGFLVRQRSNRGSLPFVSIFSNKDGIEIDVVEPIDGILPRGATKRFLFREFHMPNNPPPLRKLVLVPPASGGVNMANAVEFQAIQDIARGFREYVAQSVTLSKQGDWLVGYQKKINNQIQVQFIAKWTVQ
ncbi:hypothetical protein HDU93_009753 [Gonapodya sp. JEL0774]|nr:hypothetical protein HDU93_009753 [Gonapodya sp. JEL0774]